MDSGVISNPVATPDQVRPQITRPDAQSAVQVPLDPALIALLRRVRILASLDDAGLRCLEPVVRRRLADGEVLLTTGETVRRFWLMLDGSIEIIGQMLDGQDQKMHTLEPGEAFGEVMLLANIPSTVTMRSNGFADLLELDEDQFWRLLSQCPQVRRAVLGNMSARLAKMQSASLQKEKMATLGTLAAGLMHELNNPGAAARRASSQLRENLMRMHELTARFTKAETTPEQKECLYDLQQYVLSAEPVQGDSLALSDAEQALGEWMDEAQIEDAWRIAPTLSTVGIDPARLACAKSSFSGPIFSDALNWVEALVSSVQLVGTIEESIGRVSDLVYAVKTYVYEGRGQLQAIDVNRSIDATLVILGHKLREKQVVLDKDFAADLPAMTSACQGLNQVWTNLLDNAIHAVPQQGHIKVRTWTEPGIEPDKPMLCVLIGDNGEGIPPESQSMLGQAFYTTKPVGVGTGLGLGIVYRIVEQYGGSVRFSSMAGETEFVVRLPVAHAQSSCALPQNS